VFADKRGNGVRRKGRGVICGVRGVGYSINKQIIINEKKEVEKWLGRNIGSQKLINAIHGIGVLIVQNGQRLIMMCGVVKVKRDRQMESWIMNAKPKKQVGNVTLRIVFSGS
jgi:hypothetical protein